MSRAVMARDDEHTKTIEGLCRLMEHLWIRGQRVKAIHGPSVNLLAADVAIVSEQSENRLRGCAALSIFSSLPSEGCT